MNDSREQPSPVDDTTFVCPTDEAPIVRLHNGRTDALRSLANVAVLPGAFNPIHEGHWTLSAVAAQVLGRPVCFELSLTNVDKPVLSRDDVSDRIAPLTRAATAHAPILLTNAPRFVDKARLFPASWFVTGFDTASRILDARYYEQSADRRDECLRQLRSLGARFLVAGRLITMSDRTVFAQANDLPVPDEFEDLFTAIPESEFRIDISSTEIRQRCGDNA